MAAYYNEIDPFAAAWLRALIKAGHIADGEVDERSILEVQPDDLRGFTQCHFFAGIGVWSYALRCAGWPDSRPVWTGSCPCQPFSSAGKGDEFADERHLWPAFFRLIRECRPVACFGEQVASKDALAWLDHVSTDLEGEGYTFGAVDTCAAGFGAPHIRQRLYFVAHHEGERRGEAGASSGRPEEWIGFRSESLGVADSGCERRQQDARSAPSNEEAHGGARRDECEQNGYHIATGGSATRVALGDARRAGLEEQRGGRGTPCGQARTKQGEAAERASASTGATNGFWRDAEWLPCRDGKARPVEPGTSPLAHGAPNRVGRLRGYGNAICAPQAQEFVRAFMEVTC